MLLAKARCEAVDHVHGAMLAAGAADGDREVAAIVALIVRDARLDELRDLVDEAPDIRVRLQESDHFRIAAREAPERGLPVRIRQRARVEHEIGVARQSMLEAEGFEHDREAALVPLLDALADQLAQLV